MFWLVVLYLFISLFFRLLSFVFYFQADLCPIFHIVLGLINLLRGISVSGLIISSFYTNITYTDMLLMCKMSLNCKESFFFYRIILLMWLFSFLKNFSVFYVFFPLSQFIFIILNVVEITSVCRVRW